MDRRRFVVLLGAAACARPGREPEPTVVEPGRELEPARMQGGFPASRGSSEDQAVTDGVSVGDDAATEALRRRAAALRKRHGGDGFTVLVEPPFVVIGNEAPEVVAQRAEGTIRWASERLRAQFFDRSPDRVIDIWLFADARSYREGARSLFGDEPDTPYGYFSSYHDALVMNIATGGGTLVHEMVHPFIEADFPRCPSWFDEGLASLYEQSADRDGQIWGLTNWRLAGLQEAIADDRVPTFRTLTATSREDFYERDPGTNYAQARYLCHWLQEHGKLEPFYRAFRDGHRDDPTGYLSLQDAIGTKDMSAFERKWKRYVMALTF